jgi:acetyltransferase-like isoleucine patch superfamily enzyme
MASFTTLRDAVLLRWWRWLVTARLRSLGVEGADRLTPYGWPIVTRHPGSQIRVGARVVLCSVARFTALGVRNPVLLRTLRPEAVITIGDDCGLSGTVICAAQSVTIGKECLFGANVTIADTDFHPLQPLRRRFCNDWNKIGVAPVRIGDNVFIGTGAFVGKGVTIGDHAVVGAGAVVTQDVPAGHIVAGNPARVIRRIE